MKFLVKLKDQVKRFLNIGTSSVSRSGISTEFTAAIFDFLCASSDTAMRLSYLSKDNYFWRNNLTEITFDILLNYLLFFEVCVYFKL